MVSEEDLKEEEEMIKDVNEAAEGCGGCAETWKALSEYREEAKIEEDDSAVKPGKVN